MNDRMTASAYHVISKEVGTREFLDPHKNINNPHWQRSGIINFFYKYYIVIGDTLAGFFLDVLFLLLAGILSELYEKLTKNKDWITKKKYREEFVWVTSLLWLHAHLSMSFFITFFVYFPFQVTYLLNGPNKDTWYCYRWYSV